MRPTDSPMAPIISHWSQYRLRRRSLLVLVLGYSTSCSIWTTGPWVPVRLPAEPYPVCLGVWWQVVYALHLAQALPLFSGVVMIDTGTLDIPIPAQKACEQALASLVPC